MWPRRSGVTSCEAKMYVSTWVRMPRPDYSSSIIQGEVFEEMYVSTCFLKGAAEAGARRFRFRVPTSLVGQSRHVLASLALEGAPLL